jgi:glycosyltransferase involved in cell wall biosynthesis
MTSRKNPEILFALARELKKARQDFVLLIHADAADPGRTCDPTMEVLCHDVSDVVKFSPNVEWSSLPSKEYLNLVYNTADIFVSGHGGEGFGVPACEAGLCEKPFVMTDCTTTREFGGNGIHGFGAPIMASKTVLNIQRPIPDYKKMAELCAIMLNDEMLRFKMGASFRKWVLENCSREVVSDQWTKIFEKCLVKKVTVKHADNKA